MTNFEKYKEEIIKISKNGFGFALGDYGVDECGVIGCSQCAFLGEMGICDSSKTLWLYQEYEEPSNQKYEEYFFQNPYDSYAIYQLKDNACVRKLWFRRYKSLEEDGITVERKHYNTVYSGELNIAGTTIERLNRLWEIFNVEHPKDFVGHSMSVGDVIALRQDGKISYHYVDSSGFKELTDF